MVFHQSPMANLSGAASVAPPSLPTVQDQITLAVTRLRKEEKEDLAYELERVADDLGEAMRSEQHGNLQRRAQILNRSDAISPISSTRTPDYRHWPRPSG